MKTISLKDYLKTRLFEISLVLKIFHQAFIFQKISNFVVMLFFLALFLKVFAGEWPGLLNF